MILATLLLDTCISKHLTMAENPPTKRKKIVQPSLEDAYAMGRDMMNRSSKKMGAIQSEDRQFRDLFGVGAIVALAAFAWLDQTELLPVDGTFMHLLWTLCFLKVYPTETALSALCGGADPKTIRKYIWPMIVALANLEVHLVSQNVPLIHSFIVVTS